MRGNKDSRGGNPEISRQLRKKLRKARQASRGWGKRRKEKVREIYQRRNKTWMNTHTTALMESIVTRKKKERKDARKKAVEEKKKADAKAAEEESQKQAAQPAAKTAAKKAPVPSRRQAAPVSRALY